MDLQYEFERFMIIMDRMWLKGWITCNDSNIEITKISFESSNILSFGVPFEQGDGKITFDYKFSIPEILSNNNQLIFDSPLRVYFSDGTHRDITKCYETSIQIDPKGLQQNFIQTLLTKPQGNFLELGSSGLSGTFAKTHFLPSGWTYTGFDIRAGPNVDVVGDAHELSKSLSLNHFDAVFSVSVFEHLFMPWKVALELNKVLKTGGIGYILTHQAWPVHCLPWDYWRFSEHAWLAIFNKYTGFEIIDVAMTCPASLFPYIAHPGANHNIQTRSYQTSMVLFRKVSETQLEWPVDLKDIISTMYPHHD